MGRNAVLDNRRAFPVGFLTPPGNPIMGPRYHLASVDPEIWASPKQLASYTIGQSPLPGGTSIVLPFAIKDEADFLVMGLSASVQDPSTFPPANNNRFGGSNLIFGGATSSVLMQVTDARIGYDWFSQPVPVDNVCDGSPGGPGAMVYGYRCVAGSVMNVLLISLQGLNVNWNVAITFWGAEIFA